MEGDRIFSLRELRNKVCGRKIIIYGAGMAGKALAMYLLSDDEMADNVYCIAVTQKQDNPDLIMGIPVCSIKEINLSDDVVVIIAVLEKTQGAIEDLLKELGCNTYLKMSNALYAELRRKSPNIELEIEQKLSGIEAKLNRLERCISAGTRYYAEALEPSEYREELQQWYMNRTGRSLDLDNPVTFNEKIQWTKLYGVTPLMTRLADKYAVRQWVSEKIGEEYLVPLLGVWDRFDDIDFDTLPDSFVLKCNHGSGWNMIVKNKKDMNIGEAKWRFNRWLNTNCAFAGGGLELQYRDIEPKIIAERLLCENGGQEPRDYKVFVFGGKAAIVQVDIDRFTRHRRNLYTPDWELLSESIGYPSAPDVIIEKPKCLDELLNLSERLGEGFAHVRVDFYIVDEHIYFGEMTFTHGNGREKFSSEEFARRLGDLFKIE